MDYGEPGEYEVHLESKLKTVVRLFLTCQVQKHLNYRKGFRVFSSRPVFHLAPVKMNYTNNSFPVLNMRYQLREHNKRAQFVASRLGRRKQRSAPGVRRCYVNTNCI